MTGNGQMTRGAFMINNILRNPRFSTEELVQQQLNKEHKNSFFQIISPGFFHFYTEFIKQFHEFFNYESTIFFNKSACFYLH